MERLTTINPYYKTPCLKGECDYIAMSNDTQKLLREAVDLLAAYEDTGLTPEEITRLHTLIEQQGKELNRRDQLIRDSDKELGIVQNKLCQYLAENKQLKEQRMNDITELQDLCFALIDEREKCNYWELEAKKYCAALGEQKIKLQMLKCEMCKDIGKCEEC